MKMRMSPVSVNAAELSQRQFCLLTGIDMATANDWVSRRIVEVDKTEGWRVKGGRRFTLRTAWRARCR